MKEWILFVGGAIKKSASCAYLSIRGYITKTVTNAAPASGMAKKTKARNSPPLGTVNFAKTKSLLLEIVLSSKLNTYKILIRCNTIFHIPFKSTM